MQHPSTLKASAQGKQRIKEARERKKWLTDAETNDQPLREASKLLDPQNKERWNEKYLKEFIGKNGKLRPYAEGVSSGTWKRFLLGDTIKAETFKAFCQTLELSWQEVAELDNSRLTIAGDPPNLSPFYGRTWYLEKLQQWVVQEQARLILLYGQSGIGKTSLIRQFIEQIRTESSQFDEIIWLSSTSSFPDIFPDQTEVFNSSISTLFELLKQQRNLIVFDEWTETLGIEGDRVRYLEQDYDAAKLLHKMRQEILKNENSSCFILIGGNEKPKNTDEITEEGRSKQFRSIRLEGMGRRREDYDEFNDDKEILLTAEGLHGKEGELRAFLTRYSNPSDLKSVAKRARNVFGGEVSRFVTQYSALIDADIDERLKKQWGRLSEVERVLLYWLAVRSESCSFERLEKDLSCCGVQWDSLIEILNSLIEMQALVERDENSEFKISGVWRKFIIKNMVRKASEEISRAIQEDRVQNTELFLSLAFVTLDARDEQIENEQMRRVAVPILDELIAKLENKSNVRKGLERLLASLQEHGNTGVYGIQNIETLLSRLNSH